MFKGPFYDESKGTSREFSFEQAQALNCDACPEISVFDVKMGRRVIPIINRHYHPKKSADLRHGVKLVVPSEKATTFDFPSLVSRVNQALKRSSKTTSRL